MCEFLFFAGGQFLVCMSLKNVADIWLWTISCVGRFWPWPSTGKNVAKIVAKTGRGERGQGCSQRTRPPCSSFCKLLNLDILCGFYIQNTFLQIWQRKSPPFWGKKLIFGNFLKKFFYLFILAHSGCKSSCLGWRKIFRWCVQLLEDFNKGHCPLWTDCDRWWELLGTGMIGSASKLINYFQMLKFSSP